MPVHQGKDSAGHYYQWGSQKKYYYSPDSSKDRRRAKRKAHEQGKAIRANGYDG